MPSRKRNVSSVAVLLDGSVLLFDCGEGTQRQLMHSGISFMRVDWIVLSHFHGDHILGIPGLLQSMSLSNRKKKLTFIGPAGTAALLNYLKKGGLIPSAFPTAAAEVRSGSKLKIGDYLLTAANATHGTMALSYRVDGKVRPGRFYPARAARLGLQPGPQFSKLQHNRQIRVGGRVVKPSDVMGKPRPGPSVGYALDTRPNRAIAKLMKDVDVLIFDSTFAADLAGRARITGHSTCVEAATVAREAGARRVYLDHISGRYEDPSILLDEARAVFKESYLARDFLRFVVRPRN